MQPRSRFDDARLEDLTASIVATGVIQPIVVRPREGRYELVAGERRWRASQKAKLTTIPAVVREVTDRQMLLFALIENLQREDLNPIDRARGYLDCCQRFSLKPEDVAEAIGEDRSTITNYIRLLDLPQSVQDLVNQNALSMGHARSLLGLMGLVDIHHIAAEAVAEGHSVRYLEELARRIKAGEVSAKQTTPREPKPKRPHIRDLEERFSQALQTRVTINEGRKKNTGRITIEYFSLDDFDRITECLGLTMQDL